MDPTCLWTCSDLVGDWGLCAVRGNKMPPRDPNDDDAEEEEDEEDEDLEPPVVREPEPDK